MSNFTRTTDLPQFACTRQDFYTTMETLNPTVTVTDDDTITIVNDKFQVGAGVPRSTKTTITFEDLAGGGAETTVNVCTLPAGSWVVGVAAKHSVAFAGGTATDVRIDIEASDTATALLANVDVFTAAADTNYAAGSPTAPLRSFATGGVTVDAAVRVTGDVGDSITAGSVDIWVIYLQLV